MSQKSKRDDEKENSSSTSSRVYIVKWARSSEVKDWDYEMLRSVETCSNTIAEAMGYVTGDYIAVGGGAVGDNAAMLGSKYLRKDSGVYCSYATLSGAKKGLKECLAEETKHTRADICKICGIDSKAYKKMQATNELVEYPDEPGPIPKSAKPVSTVVGCYFAWGTFSLYDQDTAHAYLHCCTEIGTELACWIEELALVG